jgi:hypothetical protein
MAEQAIQDANPQGTPNAIDNSQAQVTAPTPQLAPTFPYWNDRNRILGYTYYNKLLMGEHFEAFNMKIADERYSREYSKLRYVMVNFAGLISKVVADMLFTEPIKLKSPTGDKTEQAWLDAFSFENKLQIQNYESALTNSALGDALYKVRLGERFDGDGEPTVIMEDITPTIYFPKVDGFNVRAEPKEKELAWTFYKGKDKYLRKEIHTPGQIVNEVWSMENDKILTQQSIGILDANIPDVEETGINRHLIVHVPNWKTGNRSFGISDYYDVDKLIYAINNRYTKIDNILDNHSDPILMVPPGILDDKGRVRKKDGRVIEMGEDTDGKPEYIVWDASLENAFKEIEKLVEAFFMVTEISPDILGMGKGQSDSGRALKYKILRTIAKVSRKKLYYHLAIQEAVYVSMLMAQAHGVKVQGLAAPKNAFVPDIEWQDGIPQDMGEQVDIEAKRLDSGTTTVPDAIMRLDGVDEDTAKKQADEIKEENKVDLPVSTLSTPFGPKNPNQDPKNNPDPKSNTNPAGK